MSSRWGLKILNDLLLEPEFQGFFFLIFLCTGSLPVGTRKLECLYCSLLETMAVSRVRRVYSRAKQDLISAPSVEYRITGLDGRSNTLCPWEISSGIWRSWIERRDSELLFKVT